MAIFHLFVTMTKVRLDQKKKGLFLFFLKESYIYLIPQQLLKVVVQLPSHLQLFSIPWTAAHQASRSFTVSWSLLKFMPLSQWCYLTISSSATLFSFGLQSFLASRSFPVSRLFKSAGQRIGVSASASVLPMNIQGWFPFGMTGLISLQSKRLSRVFSTTTVWKHQFFGAQPSLWSNSHIHTWLLENP